MKKLPLFLLTLCSIGSLYSQQQTTKRQGSTNMPNTGFYETIPLRDMPAQTEQDRQAAEAHRDFLEARRKNLRPAFPNFKVPADISDPVRQQTAGSTASGQTLVNFDGQVAGGGCPPDPDGAVGLTQYVQAINSSYQVFSKTGTALTAVIDLKTIFPNIPGDDGDPIVLYDKFAGRWFIAEFQVSKAPCGFSVAISKTSDATGAYYVYNFSNPNWTTQNYPDYPKFSIWTDGYYMTGQFDPEAVVVLDRTRMLAGKTSAGLIYTPTPDPPHFFGGNNSLFSAAKTLDCDASALPPYGSPEYMVFYENISSGSPNDKIVFYKLVHDTTAKTLTISRADSLSPATFNGYFTGGTQKEISQPGAPNSLDVLDGTFNYRAPFMTFTGYNAVVLCNTVNVGGGVAGIRWYELRQTGVGKAWTIYQQGTYAPNDGISRWNGSIGMDMNGNIAIEYNVSNTTIYPGISYSGRMFGDPAGIMSATEVNAIAGSGSAVNCGSRWGDYSAMTLDPSDNLTYWVTNEYDKGGAEATRIFSFKLTSALGIKNPIDNAEFKVYQSAEALQVLATRLPSDERVQVDLFDLAGKQISSRFVQPESNAIQTTVPVGELVSGTYFVRIGNLNYQRVFKVLVTN
jgi:hypothetical protein